jgi:molybdopterin synthase catalytic subunit
MSSINIRLLEQPLSAEQCAAWVEDPGAGGVAVFVGTVRNQTQGRPVTRLEFEAYGPMALREMEKIAQSILQQWPAKRVAIHHRTGTLTIGEAAVVIAVSAPHRGAAFAACQYAIDTLKQTVPIWKKEVFEDGEVWVGSRP